MNDDFDKKLNSDAKLLRELEKIPVFLNVWEKREDEDGNAWDVDASGVLDILRVAQNNDVLIPQELAMLLFERLGYDFNGNYSQDYNDDEYGIYLLSDKLNAMLKPLIKSDMAEMNHHKKLSTELRLLFDDAYNSQELFRELPIIDISFCDSQNLIRDFLIEIKKRRARIPYKILLHLYNLADGKLEETYWKQIKSQVVHDFNEKFEDTSKMKYYYSKNSIEEKISCDSKDFICNILGIIQKESISIAYEFIEILYEMSDGKIKNDDWGQIRRFVYFGTDVETN